MLPEYLVLWYSPLPPWWQLRKSQVALVQAQMQMVAHLHLQQVMAVHGSAGQALLVSAWTLVAQACLRHCSPRPPLPLLVHSRAAMDCH